MVFIAAAAYIVFEALSCNVVVLSSEVDSGVSLSPEDNAVAVVFISELSAVELCGQCSTDIL